MKLRDTLLSIPAEGVWLEGRLHHAPDVRGLILLLQAGAAAEPEDNDLAAELQASGFATLELNLLTRHEMARDSDASFNVPQLANRTLAATEWISHQPPLTSLSIGLVGTGTASAAAVRAAWKEPERFDAVVCLAGRPDLAGANPLKSLSAPIRMIAVETDPDLPIVRHAYELIEAERDLNVLAADIPASTIHALAIEWLASRLPAPREIAVGDESAAADIVAPTNEHDG